MSFTTPDEVRDRAIALVKSGETIPEVARITGMAESKIRYLVRKLGIGFARLAPPRPSGPRKPRVTVTDRLRQRVLELAMQFRPDTCISRETGLCVCAVRKIRVDAGLPNFRRGPDIVRERALRKAHRMVLAGSSMKKAAEKHGLPVSALVTWERTHGRPPSERRISVERRGKALAMVEAGVSLKAAGNAVHADISTVSRWCKAARIRPHAVLAFPPGPRGPRARTVSLRKRILGMLERGLSLVHIANECGVVQSYVAAVGSVVGIAKAERESIADRRLLALDELLSLGILPGTVPRELMERLLPEN